MSQALMRRFIATRGDEQKPVGNLVCSVVLTLLGIGIAVRGASYGVVRSDGIVGPGFLPIVSGTLLAVFSAAVGFKGVVQQSARQETPQPLLNVPSLVTSGEDGGVSEIDALEHDVHGELPDSAISGKAGSARSLTIVILSLFLGLFLSRWLGMIVALTLAVFSTLYLAERKNLVISTAVSLVIGAIIYFIFVKFLQIPLPWGVINRYLPSSVVS